MPKAPIRSREAIFFKIRGSGNAGDSDRNQLLKVSEWNVVVTELGTMVEPANMAPQVGGDFNRIVQIDVTDSGVNAVRVMEESDFQNTFGTGGQGMADYNA